MKRLVLFLNFFCLSAYAVTPGETVENFRLEDHKRDSHELYYYKESKAIAFMVQGNGCPIARNAAVDYHKLKDQYESKGIKFLMINSNLQDSVKSIRDEAQEYEYEIPILKDETQLVGESLLLTRTGEVFLIDTSDWKIIYSGALNDRLTYENQKEVATKFFLEDAIKNTLAGKEVEVKQTEALGCLMNFPEQRNLQKHTKISYSDEIAPILISNCVGCHRKGGIGPWAMTDYKMIQGFSPMIREVLRTKRMPPWHADPEVGHFSNDRSLTEKEFKTLVHWIEAGSPRGKGEDPLAKLQVSETKWANEQIFGRPPDYVVNLPKVEIPSSGVIDYKYLTKKNPITEDIWVGGVEYSPGDSQVLHHIITSFGKNLNRREMEGFSGYAPGITNGPFPDNTGIFLPEDVTFLFQMHYTAVGRKTSDQTQMGIWTLDEPPKYDLESITMINTRIKIPANSNNHVERDTHKLKEDAWLYSMLPHAHYRGKSMRIYVVYPNGTREVLLNVPNYDFNWQTDYSLDEPKLLPKGSILVQINMWDNSSSNKSNPNPNRDVYWGEQSFDEMLFGNYLIRYASAEEVENNKDKLNLLSKK